jgi:hypothetical protein
MPLGILGVQRAAPKISDIHTALVAGDTVFAERLLLDFLTHTQTFETLYAVLGKSAGIVRYVRTIQFDHGTKTASCNILSGRIRMGVRFFLEHMKTVRDLIFVLLHERNHFLIRQLKFAQSKGLTADQQNVAEDTYINGPLWTMLNPPFIKPFYKDITSGFSLMLYPNPDRWGAWLKSIGYPGHPKYQKNYGRRPIAHLHRHLFTTGRYRTVDYKMWMSCCIYLQQWLQKNRPDLVEEKLPAPIGDMGAPQGAPQNAPEGEEESPSSGGAPSTGKSANGGKEGKGRKGGVSAQGSDDPPAPTPPDPENAPEEAPTPDRERGPIEASTSWDNEDAHDMLEDNHVLDSPEITAEEDDPYLEEDDGTETETYNAFPEGWDNRPEQSDIDQAIQDTLDLGMTVYGDSEWFETAKEVNARGVSLYKMLEAIVVPKIDLDGVVGKLLDDTWDSSLGTSIRELRSVARNLGAKTAELTAIVGAIVSSRALQPTEMYAQTAYPYEVGRREIVQLGAGLLPTSWSLMVSSDAEKLPLYMDVSGSMTSWYPFIPWLVQHLKERVSTVCQFSSVVIERSPETQVLLSTGGTDFDEVAQHILANNYKGAVIFTDNCANLDKDLENQLRARHVEIYLISTSGWRRGWKGVATKNVQINKDFDEKDEEYQD